jgi:hypothetical protein
MVNWSKYRSESFKNEPIAKKAIGRFMPLWISEIVNVNAGRSQKKMSIFSAHDTTLAPMLAAMQVMPDKYTGYSSNVNFTNSDRLGIL